ncbi:MBL fold metallo-hydrolase [Candidatus Harpocratesius sp.]
MFFNRNPTKKIVQKIIPNLYYFAEFPMLDCNMYVLLDESSGKFCLIDTGNGKSFNGFKKSIHEIGLNMENLTSIIITHEHLDHILGLYSILKEIDISLLNIYVAPFTNQILEQGNEQLICPRELGISADVFEVKIRPLTNLIEVHEGNTISFGSFNLEVLETPGHSIGSITLFDKSHKILFPGDVVFPQGSFGRYDFPGGDLQKLKLSIKRLSDLQVEILCSGHMSPVLQNTASQIQLSLRNISSLTY